jgi:hypothetical protein
MKKPKNLGFEPVHPKNVLLASVTEFPVYFCFLRAAEKVQNDFFVISMKFPIDRIPSCLIFEFWDFGRIMAVGHWAKSQNRGSRVFSLSP